MLALLSLVAMHRDGVRRAQARTASPSAPSVRRDSSPSAPARRDGLAPLDRAVVGVRHRRGRERARRRLPQRRGPTRRVDHASAGAAVAARHLCRRRDHRRHRRRDRRGDAHELPRRSAVRRARALPGRVLERAGGDVGAGGDRGRLRVLAHGVPAPPRPVAAGARGPVGVPRSRARWTRGRGCTLRPARRDRVAGGDGVRRLLGGHLPRAHVRGPRAVRPRAARDDHGLGRRRRGRRGDRRAGERADGVALGFLVMGFSIARPRPPGSDWSRRSRPTIRRTRSPPSRRSATPGSSGARRSSRGSPQASTCGPRWASSSARRSGS